VREKVLIVDDDLEILNSFRRHFYKTYDLVTASSGEEGLKRLAEGLFVVIVSDYLMSSMDGVKFLAQAKTLAPDATRILLTGYADVNIAIESVNEGHVFRFLTKPCTPEALARSIQAGIEYHRLVTAERELLEQTLNGSLALLAEILSLVNPAAFSRAVRIKKFVVTVVKYLNITPTWYYELAATLSQIGCVTLPPSLFDKIHQQRNLTEQEQEMLNSHPHVARKLVEKIPRLEIIAPMIDNQAKPYSDFPAVWGAALPKDPKVLGAQLLKIAIDYDDLSSGGDSQAHILRVMEARTGQYNPAILSALSKTTTGGAAWERRLLRLVDLKTGMVVNEDIITLDDLLLLRRGQEITETVLARLQNITLNSKIKEPFQTLVLKGK
jgi:response regulator RpfG family c-di-GMP phosphodiesterase